MITDEQLRKHVDDSIYKLCLELKALSGVDQREIDVIIEALEYLRDYKCECDEPKCKMTKLGMIGVYVVTDNAFDKLVRETVNRVFGEMNDEIKVYVDGGH